MRQLKFNPYLAIAALAALPLLPLVSYKEAHLVWPGADVSDLITAHLPISTFIHQSLTTWGQLPLWNPTILSGMPVLGDPLAGLAYPPVWLTYWLPSVWTYHFLLWLHLSWAGIGTYKLARSFKLSGAPALVSGIALVLSPRLLGQWGLGHASLLFSFCWTPWLLLALHRSFLSSGPAGPKSWYWWAVSGGYLGILASADPRWAPPAGILAFAFALHQFGKRMGRSDWQSYLAGATVSLAALLGSLAFMAIPFFQLLANSQRASINQQALRVSAMPAAALLQLATPNPSTWPEWGASIGTGVFILAVLSLAHRPRKWFWWGVILFSGLMSLGPATPAWRLLTSAIPGLGQLRMPGRWFLLASLAFPLLAGFGFQSVSSAAEDKHLRRINLMAVGVGGLTVMLAVARWIALGSLRTLAAQTTALSLVVAVSLITLIVVGTLRERSRVVFLLLIILELGFLSLAGLEVRSVETDLPPVLEAELPSTYGEGRVFSPSYNLSQLSATRLNLELSNGVHPLQLRRYHQFMADAVGFDPDQYSVVLPPFPDGDLSNDAPYLRDLDKLKLLNVTHVVTADPVQLKGLTEVDTMDDRWIYSVDRPFTRAWVQPIGTGSTAAWRAVELEVWSPNRIELTAEGPGLLVLSEIQYPSWAVTMDGLTVEMSTFAGLLRAVTLPPGSHYVVFRASVGAAWIGLLVTIISWLSIGFLWWKR